MFFPALRCRNLEYCIKNNCRLNRCFVIWKNIMLMKLNINFIIYTIRSNRYTLEAGTEMTLNIIESRNQLQDGCCAQREFE